MAITRSSDYIKEINKLFPEVSEKDIKKIMEYGWRQLYLLNSYGGDTIITDKTFWMYVGKLTPDSFRHFRYYCRKLATRIRVLYKRKRIPWDGYYYFGLSKRQYEKYLEQKNAKGRPRKNFKYGNIILYKIKDECKILEFASPYIFRVPYISDFGMTFFKRDFITGNAELIETREIPKFKDILITNNNYEVLK